MVDQKALVGLREVTISLRTMAQGPYAQSTKYGDEGGSLLQPFPYWIHQVPDWEPQPGTHRWAFWVSRQDGGGNGKDGGDLDMREAGVSCDGGNGLCYSVS